MDKGAAFRSWQAGTRQGGVQASVLWPSVHEAAEVSGGKLRVVIVGAIQSIDPEMVKLFQEVGVDVRSRIKPCFHLPCPQSPIPCLSVTGEPDRCVPWYAIRW